MHFIAKDTLKSKCDRNDKHYPNLMVCGLMELETKILYLDT